MSEITMDSLSIDKVSQKLFFLHNAPTKPMVATSYFQDPSFNNGNYMYQIDIAVYLPTEITNLGLVKWSNNLFISECPPTTLNPKTINPPIGNFRQITIEFDNIDMFFDFNQFKFLPTLLKKKVIEFDLYTLQLKYHTKEEDLVEKIFVNYVYDDPETTRGTVTTVRDISETQTT
ncbi:hypothetical protein D1816_20550 [Aquimarina sp. AD10]|uniref:hypothetical protein n=1 Tax=Aquimarina sp. AD10 TaxID=1714849 RepID=UPI000E4CB5FA|nr:hypothetical protein [Aquimarina sp. AD10]AXT62642.1 hypothetical protein D1816_20550 [Aquimarina sp. AD10]RKM98362.1 hypothetical protein D7033_13105 [Aquimarina sp. AD10]